jgi:hypothetical protein
MTTMGVKRNFAMSQATGSLLSKYYLHNCAPLLFTSFTNDELVYHNCSLSSDNSSISLPALLLMKMGQCLLKYDKLLDSSSQLRQQLLLGSGIYMSINPCSSRSSKGRLSLKAS